MEYEYRQATADDLQAVKDIYVSAQEFMERNGNPQWGRGFPNETDIAGGVYGGIIYVVTCRGETAAVFSVVNYDADYDEIDGKWLTESNYLAVHRVAVSENFRGKGAARYIVDCAAAEIARERGRMSLRFDTHEKNAPMLGLLSTSGFTRCGKICLGRDGSERIAFEKPIE